MEETRPEPLQNPNLNPSRSNNGGFEVQKLDKFNKILLFSFLLISPLLPRDFASENDGEFAGDYDGDDAVPKAFRRYPSIYYGSQVLLATGLFSAFLGFMYSGRRRGERISFFCAVYSFICLVMLVILLLIATFLPESNLPMWLRKNFYCGAISLTDPLPLFVILILMLVVPFILHFALFGRHRLRRL